MAFKDTILTFEDDKIVIDDGRPVMMIWEDIIMEFKVPHTFTEVTIS